jgi:hypothetical protein
MPHTRIYMYTYVGLCYGDSMAKILIIKFLFSKHLHVSCHRKVMWKTVAKANGESKVITVTGRGGL